MTKPKPTIDALVVNLDDRIFRLLSCPKMYATSPEPLVALVLELLDIRNWADPRPLPDSSGERTRTHHVFRRLGFMQGPAVCFPDDITDELVAKLCVIAIEGGYDPGDRADRSQAWRKHWQDCSTCHTGSDQCSEGKDLLSKVAPL